VSELVFPLLVGLVVSALTTAERWAGAEVGMPPLSPKGKSPTTFIGVWDSVAAEHVVQVAVLVGVEARKWRSGTHRLVPHGV
jgi:hypothetical protein